MKKNIFGRNRKLIHKVTELLIFHRNINIKKGLRLLNGIPKILFLSFILVTVARFLMLRILQLLLILQHNIYNAANHYSSIKCQIWYLLLHQSFPSFRFIFLTATVINFNINNSMSNSGFHAAQPFLMLLLLPMLSVVTVRCCCHFVKRKNIEMF